jgi:hypothetical protein
MRSSYYRKRISGILYCISLILIVGGVLLCIPFIKCSLPWIVISIIAGVYNKQDNGFKVPHGNTKRDGGVLLFIITRPEQIKRVVEYLTKR